MLRAYLDKEEAVAWNGGAIHWTLFTIHVSYTFISIGKAFIMPKLDLCDFGL